jgi:hypothetical protein
MVSGWPDRTAGPVSAPSAPYDSCATTTKVVAELIYRRLHLHRNGPFTGVFDTGLFFAPPPL